MVNQESILGLLIRAYGEICAQELNERSRHLNDSAANAYKNALEHSFNAIMSVVNAEMCARRDEAYKRAKEDCKKEMRVNG